MPCHRQCFTVACNNTATPYKFDQTNSNMKFNLSALSLFIGIFLISCQSSKLKKEAEIKTKDFFSVLKEGDEKKLVTIYPDFDKFDTYFKSDSARINSSSEKNGLVTVSVHNRYTNGYGKVTEKDILLFFKKDSTQQLKLIDSKGLSGFDEKDDYIFGISTGCINKNTDTTDQQILKAIQRAKIVMLDKAVDVYLELKSQIKVVSWSWESGYSGSASGKGIVKNSSTFSVPSLKYKITYKNNNGEEITNDDGYVDYDPIEAGESKSFTFYTSYVGNATRATIDLTFDEDLIYKYLAKKEWTGKECDEYFKQHPEKLKEL